MSMPRGPRPLPLGVKKVSITISLTPTLIRQLTEIAERDMITRSALIESHMRRVVDRMERRAA